MAWKKEQEEYMDLCIEVFKNKFEETFNEWEGNFTDDRELFCNLYRNALPEFEKMKKVNSDFITVAFNRLMKQDQSTMFDIIERFTILNEGE